MARNASESDFRTSKMAANKKNKSFVLIWNGQKCDRKWIADIQNVLLIWNGKKCDTKWFLDIQNGYRRPCLKKHLQKSCASDLNNVRTDCWPTTTWYKFTFDQYVANPDREGRSRDNSWLQFNGVIQTKQRLRLSHTNTKRRRELFPNEGT